MIIRPVLDSVHAEAARLITEHFGSARVVSRGVVRVETHLADLMAALVFERYDPSAAQISTTLANETRGSVHLFGRTSS